MSTTKPLPKTIKLGGLTYEVRITKGLRSPDGNTSLMGMVWATKPVIEIEADVALEMQWQVLWHELLHAFLRHAGWAGEHDESLIEGLSNQIYWVLAQNGQNLLPGAK